MFSAMSYDNLPRSMVLEGFAVRDLREWYRVSAKCLDCGRLARVPHARLRRNASDDAMVMDMARRFRCRQCGHRGAQVTVSKLPRNV